MSAEFDQPKDDYPSDDENLLDFENHELERELIEMEGGDTSATGAPPGKEAKAGGDKAAAGGEKK